MRETRDRIEIFDGPREVAAHRKVLEPPGQRVIDPAHRAPRGLGRSKRATSPEEIDLLLAEPALAGYVAAFRSRHPGRMLRMLRRLQAMVRDYPREPLLAAVGTALEYGLFDLERLDRMVLRHIARDYFVLGDTAGSPTCFLRTPAGALPSIHPVARSGFQLNPYFLAEPTARDTGPAPPGLHSQPRLFASDAEANAYLRRPADTIQMPNRLMRDTVDLQAIRGHFPDEENRYLWTCRLDLVTYNLDGYLLSVEEVQRGSHHNQADWIRKDAIKRKALELSGVPFHESF